MAQQGKKIVFEGVDQTSNAAQAAKKNLIDLHDTNIKKTKEVNTVIQQGNDLLKEQLQLLEKQKQVIASMSSQGLTGAQAGAVGQITQKLFATPERVNPQHIRSFAKILEGMHLTGDPKGLSEKLIQKTQELIDTQKLQHKEALQHHLKDDETNKPSNDKFKEFVTSFDKKKRDKDLGSITPEEIAAKKHSLTEEKELRKLVSGESGGKHDEMHLPHSIADALEKGFHKVLNVVGAGAVAGGVIEMVKEAAEMLFKREGIIAQATSAEEVGFEISPLTGLPMSEIEKEWRHIPGKKRHFQERNSLDAQKFKYAAVTGSVGNFGGMTELGISSAEMTAAATGVAKNLGRSAKYNDVASSLFAEKVFGVNAGGIERLSRFSKEEVDPKNMVASIIDTMDSREKAPEWADMLVKIGQEHLTVLSKIDQKSALNLMNQFKLGGGAMAQNAETLAPIIQTLDQSLSHPKNAFAEARQMSVLSKLMPGASYFQLMKAKSHGIMEPGVLKGTIEQMVKHGGGNDENIELQLMQMGLTPEQAETTLAAYKNGSLESDTVKSGKSALSKVNMGAFSSTYTRSKAAIESAYAISPEAGKAEVERQMAGPKPEYVENKRTETEKFAVATGDAAAKMQAVAQQAEIGAKMYKENAEQVKAANEALKSFLKDYKQNNNTGIKKK